MRSIRDYWRTFQAAAGIRAQLLGVFVTIAIGYADFINGKLMELGVAQFWHKDAILGFPSWYLSIVFALGLIFVWTFSFAHQLRMNIRRSRVDLSKLREDGVKLRNLGLEGFETLDAYDAWMAETRESRRNVYRRIRNISVADAEWFKTMDVVPPARIPIDKPNSAFLDSEQTAAFHKRYDQHDFQVFRFGEMIRDLWGKQT